VANRGFVRFGVCQILAKHPSQHELGRPTALFQSNWSTQFFGVFSAKESGWLRRKQRADGAHDLTQPNLGKQDQRRLEGTFLPSEISSAQS
jgi:hypothetical protein